MNWGNNDSQNNVNMGGNTQGQTTIPNPNVTTNVTPNNNVQSNVTVPPVVNPTSVPPVNQNTPVVNPNVPNNESVVEPTQNVINTSKKRSSNIVWFIVIIMVGVFIYFIDEILAYFNQSFTPVVVTELSENGSSNLTDGFMKLDTSNSYIKVKSIRFNNVKRGNGNAIFISYISDKNYTASLPLGIVIELYNESKTKIHSEDFNVVGSIESNVSRQYKLNVSEDVYKDAFYCLVKTK